ncbi:uncharacterized protein LOC106172612 [Lingula anatina]|uniref:Uncharacterized protein LOC106172612 n=1 Tax=Lingula anatina TaxID=7574 RepID=A0A1S3JG29_LINAN|nr:uncharacterized protein LOC106172612 [Lingula anatina]|eukprot:XP_013408854.1 uncharacterized protein LOC106172612 [Lingula anatina]
MNAWKGVQARKAPASTTLVTPNPSPPSPTPPASPVPDTPRDGADLKAPSRRKSLSKLTKLDIQALAKANDDHSKDFSPCGKVVTSILDNYGKPLQKPKLPRCHTAPARVVRSTALAYGRLVVGGKRQQHSGNNEPQDVETGTNKRAVSAKGRFVSKREALLEMLSDRNVEFKRRPKTPQHAQDLFKSRRLAAKNNASWDWVLSEAYEHLQSRFEEPGQAKAFFRRISRRALIILRWIAFLKEQSKYIDRELEELMDIVFGPKPEGDKPTTRDEDIARSAGVDFDRLYFRANKELKITLDVQRTLTLPPNSRSPEMLRRVLYSLQTVKSFCDYPLDMQRKICEVGWYQSLPGRKVIVRQSHIAENFYFVLSGRALVKKVDTKQPSYGVARERVVGFIARGQSFGEVALMHHSPRSATIESMTPMQLLVVGRTDYINLFSGESVNGEPAHIAFCRNVEFLKKWPVEELLEESNKDKILFNFVKRGTVVVEDSKQCDWIYIIKSGSCNVIKKVPKPNRKRTKVALSMDLKFANLLELGPKVKTHRRPKSCFAKRPIGISMESLQIKVHEASSDSEGGEDDLTIPIVAAKNDPKLLQLSPPTIHRNKKDNHNNNNSNNEDTSSDGEDNVSEISYLTKTSDKGEPGSHDSRSIVLQVAVLQPKDVFGLENMVFDGVREKIHPSLTLVGGILLSTSSLYKCF